MAHIYKMEEWENAGRWYCGDVSALAANSNLWWYVPCLLNLSPVEYVLLLKDKFHATGFKYNSSSDVLIFYFLSLEDCRKFKNYVNKQARDKNFVTY